MGTSVTMPRVHGLQGVRIDCQARHVLRVVRNREHLRTTNRACGWVGGSDMTPDPKFVDCEECHGNGCLYEIHCNRLPPAPLNHVNREFLHCGSLDVEHCDSCHEDQGMGYPMIEFYDVETFGTVCCTVWHMLQADGLDASDDDYDQLAAWFKAHTPETGV